MRHFISMLLLCGALVSGQSILHAPPGGFVQDVHHSLRPLIGMDGCFLLEDSIGEGVVSFAFSGTNGLVKTDSSVFVLDGQGQTTYGLDATPGPALFAFAANGTPAFAYLVQAGTLLAWRTDHFEASPWDAGKIGGTLLAIANRTAGLLTAIVRRDDGRWQLVIDPTTGNIISQTGVPGAEGPVFLTAAGDLLYAQAGGFVLQTSQGLESRIAATLPHAVLEQMNTNWVHVSEPGSARQYAIWLDPGRAQIYQLPEAQP
jgi:hypothetical protein